MANMLIAGIVILLMGAAIAYIIKSKKTGAKCIGCPAGCSCAGKKDGHTACGCAEHRPITGSHGIEM